MKVMRKIIQIDEEKCDGCGQCVPACAEGSLVIVNGKARVVADNLCDGLGACLGECPNDALHIVEREAEEFDEEAVERYLEQKHQQEKPADPKVVFSGCPSAQVRQIAPAASRPAHQPHAGTGSSEPSALAHWPVQIRLVPPTAPFLKNAHLLVLADCVPVAFPTLHRDFLTGKAVMMGCPKFDDLESYRDKFEQIFRTAGVRRISVVVMEVPCCSALPVIVKKALAASGKRIPLEEVVVSTYGEILERRTAA